MAFIENCVNFLERFFGQFPPEHILAFFMLDGLGVVLFWWFGIGKDTKKKN